MKISNGYLVTTGTVESVNCGVAFLRIAGMRSSTQHLEAGTYPAVGTVVEVQCKVEALHDGYNSRWEITQRNVG